ncbi:DotI/IcmL family type IV secretion protein [Legionella hackeliae]|uniref:IcmL/DotI homolog n=1 Tax=Legionella hackeliae TaxID=449 RepID=A0A0A8UPD8_LEGHA|nr:DotI/IcmL family type IV secretion protein [Legionella hackeliae]KTD13553.1 hypothetical protein Lhac_0937 [Legionella hackeliae]CEK09401.1 IcmL/DotI homolog [Legionella hackeliae]STX49309.1 IcmL/DotI homolog [Legionella hackeliae]
MRKIRLYFLFTLFISLPGFAAPDNTQLAVWANEAIIATYTFDYKNFLPRQKEIAKYFTAAGWTAYSTALNTSKLPDTVKKNYYVVSAVATLPPTIRTVNATQWEATMPILVLYKNPQYQQKQDLLVTINFIQAPSGQGVRGLAIASLQSKVTQPPCVCQPQTEEDATTNGKPQ